MSDQRHDSGSLTLTEEDLGVDGVAADETEPLGVDSAAAAAAAEDALEQKKKARRTVRIPDDEVARPSRPPAAATPAPGAASVTQPILGQRIIAIGAPLSVPPPAVRPSSPPPANASPSVPSPGLTRASSPPPRQPSVPPPRASVPDSEPHDEPSSAPLTEPRVPSIPAPPVAQLQPVQEDDSWTPYQPLVADLAPPAPAAPRLVSPLVDTPAAPFPPAATASTNVANLPPPSQRRPSVQFEAPPAWARPPSSGSSSARESRPSYPDARPQAPSSPQLSAEPRAPYGSAPAIAVASSSVVDLATPTPGQPWGPPRDSIVDVAVDFESDVTLLDVSAAPSAPAVAEPVHARSTRIDESEIGGSLPAGYVPESDLSSSHLEIAADSGELDGPPSMEEVEIEAEPDSDARPSGEHVAVSLEEVADHPKTPPKAPPPAKPGEKGAPPAPRLAAPNLLSLGNLAPMPLTDAASQRKKGRPWWEDLFNDDFVRTGAKGVKEDYKAEVDFIEDSLGMEKGATILDLACGTGRHAIELSKRGYRMVGFDLSLAMLARAADLAQAEDQRINFVQGDMREMQFEEAFDGIYCWNTSFGYFEEDKNAQVAALVHRALRKGGQFLLDIVNRDYIIQESPTTAWFEGDACICMDEMHIDWITSRMRVKRTIMFDDGRSRELEYSVRLYSLHELGRLLHEAGFRVTEVSGLLSTPGVFFGCQSPRTLILAEKR